MNNGIVNNLTIVHAQSKSPVAEAYRILRTNISFSTVEGSLKKILITSGGPVESKSMTVCNLAIALAQAGERVVMVDADLRRPVLHKALDIGNRVGLSDVITGQAELDRALVPTAITGLSLLPSGPQPPNPAELLGTDKVRSILDQLCSGYDRVMIDSPPVTAVADPVLLSRSADGVLIVVRSGQTRIEGLKEVVERLRKAGARILGTILNDVPEKTLGYYYYYYRYEGKSQQAS